MKNSIALIGGMGPLAGVDVLQKILTYSAEEYGAVEDHEYPSIVLVSHGVKGFSNQAETGEHFKKELLKVVSDLDKHSPQIIGIACNTAHLFLDEVKKKSTSKVLNLVEVTAETAAKQPMKYLLLTSAETKSLKLYLPYLKKVGIDFGQTTSLQQAKVDQIIGLIMAHKLDAAGQKMSTLLKSVKQSGYDGILAGCTELPIAIDHAKSESGLKIISSNDVLAKTLVDEHYGKADHGK